MSGRELRGDFYLDRAGISRNAARSPAQVPFPGRPAGATIAAPAQRLSRGGAGGGHVRQPALLRPRWRAGGAGEGGSAQPLPVCGDPRGRGTPGPAWPEHSTEGSKSCFSGCSTWIRLIRRRPDDSGFHRPPHYPRKLASPQERESKTGPAMALTFSPGTLTMPFALSIGSSPRRGYYPASAHSQTLAQARHA